MKILLTTTFLFLCTYLTLAQNQSIDINGRVMHFELPISDAHIYNLSTRKGVNSDRDGKFNIKVKVNDILRLSHLEYNTIKLVITKAIIEQGSIVLHLEIMTNYLKIVELYNHDLSGVLESDSNTISIDSILKSAKYIDDILAAVVKMPNNQDFEVNKEAPYMNDVSKIKMNGVGSGVGIPMKDKENILRRELRAKKNTPERMISDFGIPYFTEKLSIPEDKIHNFLTYCDYQNIIKLYQQNNIMKVLTILKEESVEYNKIETD